MNTVVKRILFALFIFVGTSAFAQIELKKIEPAKSWDDNHFMFFTNRTLEYKKDSSITFKKHTTKQTNTLYFCRYDFEKDSIEINYKAVNTTPDKYPSEKIINNPLYTFYQKQRIERGIKNFYFVVGGYGKNFDKQVNSYMRRLKATYADSLFKKAAIIVFAWGDEDHFWRYYKGVRASKRGAADFAIFQHMMDEFVSDTAFFKTHPNDLTIDIAFSSMGNYLFKEYLEERKRQNIPIIKAYHKISLIGSVTDRHSFEQGHEFYGLNKMTDVVDVYVNNKDALLALSAMMHCGGRLGKRGPKNEDSLEDHVKIIRVSDIITIDDLPGLGHDYLLTNDILKNEILEDMNENLNNKK